MPVPESRRRANDKYNAKCGRIEIRPMRETADRIRISAAAAGESVQGYILKAVEYRMKNGIEKKAISLEEALNTILPFIDDTATYAKLDKMIKELETPF